MKRLITAILVTVFALVSAAAFAAPDKPENMFGNWQVSGKLVAYKTEKLEEVVHEYTIQPFVLEVGNKTLEDAYADFSEDEKDLAYQALRSFLSLNFLNNACSNIDFNQTIQQLNRKLYLPFASDAEPMGDQKYSKKYTFPRAGTFYPDWFTLSWGSNGFLWFEVSSAWQDNNTRWSPIIINGMFIIADDCNSIMVTGQLMPMASGTCEGRLIYQLGMNMVRCDPCGN